MDAYPRKSDTPEDRISDLPDDVLRQIVRFLPFKDAVRSSTLSKRWRSMELDVCSSFPDLNLMQGFFRYAPFLNFNKNARKQNRRCLNILDKLLRRRHGSGTRIQKFEVVIPIEYRFKDDADSFEHDPEEEDDNDIVHSRQYPLQSKLDRWMSIVANPGLSVLDLRMIFSHSELYKFHLSTLSAAKSLKTLSLEGFEICCLASHREDVSFPCLEKLSLESVVIDDFGMQSLLQGSPLLESLQINLFVGPQILKVEGLSQLKVLRVDYSARYGKIVIDAPCLRVLDMNVSPDVITLATCPQLLQKLDFKLYRLELQDIPDMSFQLEGTQLPIQEWFCRFVDKCCFLEHMYISGIPNVKKIHISSTLHSLKTLNLICNRDLASFEIVAPNLKQFYMHPNQNLPFIRLNASDQLEAHLLFCGPYHYHDELNDQWYTRWAKFLSYFNHSRALKIEAYGRETYYVPKESRKDLLPPLFGVKSLDLKMPRKSPVPFLDYVDYMLWLSPRATKLRLESSTGTEVVIKCVYDDTKVVDDSKDNCCEDCNLLEVNCWRHSLKQVIIDEFEGDEVEKQNIKSFFQEQANNLDYVEPVSKVNCLLEDGLYEYYYRLL